MLTQFSQNLYQALLLNGFVDLDRFNGGRVIDDKNIVTAFIKAEGPVWYSLCLMNLDVIPFDQIMTINGTYSAFFKRLQIESHINHIYVVNLLYGNNIDQNVKDFIKSTGPFIEAPVNNIYWAYGLQLDEFYLNDLQPTEMLNIRSLIDESYQKMLKHPQEKRTTAWELNKTAYVNSSFKPLSRYSPLTYIMIIINLVVFAVIELNGGTADIGNLIRFGVLTDFPRDDFSQYYRYFTTMFIHVGYIHLIFNCLFIYIFGSRTEKYLGAGAFLMIYLLSSLCGNVIGSLASASFTTAALTGRTYGADGAIYGLIGAMLVLSKNAARRIEGLNFYTMAIYALLCIFHSFMSPYVNPSLTIGGFITGILISFMIVKKKNKGAKVV